MTTETAVKSKMELGNNVVAYEVPQLEVFGVRREEQHTYYLSPFRAYGFQVSGTDNGVGSYGRSDFIGLRSINRDNEILIAKAIYRTMVIEALKDHSRHYDVTWHPGALDEEKIKEFVDAAYEWVEAVREKEKTQELFRRIEQQGNKPSLLDKIKNKFRKQA